MDTNAVSEHFAEIASCVAPDNFIKSGYGKRMAENFCLISVQFVNLFQIFET
jgi:hypothetical protein